MSEIRASAASTTKHAVGAEEEMSRVLPVIAGIKRKHPHAVVSIDTYKSVVAREAYRAGAEIVNDVSGFRWDVTMRETIAGLGCGAVLMHMRGRPEEWRTLPGLQDPISLVKSELKQWSETALQAGVLPDRIVLDPGFGFGKSFDENYPLILHFQELQSLGFPLLAGASRKSFIGRKIAKGGETLSPPERLFGTLAAETALILKGVHVVRTHDVNASVQASRVADAILRST